MRQPCLGRAPQGRRKRYRSSYEKVYRYRPKDLYLLCERYRFILDWHYELQKKGTFECENSKVPEVSRVLS